MYIFIPIYIIIILLAGKLTVLRYLIVEVGADPVPRDNNGLTTLHAATQGGHLDVMVSGHLICISRVCVMLYLLIVGLMCNM